MASVPMSLRVDAALASRVDAFAASVMAERPGLKVTRSDAVSMLLTKALDAEGVEAPAPAPKAPAQKGGKRTARKP